MDGCSMYEGPCFFNANGDGTFVVKVTLLVFVQRKDFEKGAWPRFAFELHGQRSRNIPRRKEYM